jgi:hypothetical protein
MRKARVRVGASQMPQYVHQLMTFPSAPATARSLRGSWMTCAKRGGPWLGPLPRHTCPP